MNNVTSRSINFVVLLFLLQLVSCAQTKPVVRNAYSFYVERLPGNIRVDKNHKPFPVTPDTTYIAYVETTSKFIRWDSAWKNGRSYSIASQLIVPAPFTAGSTKQGDRKLILTAQNGSYLWQLYLTPHEQSKTPHELNVENEIMLKGKFKKKTIYQKTGTPVELLATPSV